MEQQPPPAHPTPGPEYRWSSLLPAAVAAELDPDRIRNGRPRRTLRDWAVDFGCFFTAVLLGLAGAQAVGTNSHVPSALVPIASPKRA